MGLKRRNNSGKDRGEELAHPEPRHEERKSGNLSEEEEFEAAIFREALSTPTRAATQSEGVCYKTVTEGRGMERFQTNLCNLPPQENDSSFPTAQPQPQPGHEAGCSSSSQVQFQTAVLVALKQEITIVEKIAHVMESSTSRLKAKIAKFRQRFASQQHIDIPASQLTTSNFSLTPAPPPAATAPVSTGPMMVVTSLLSKDLVTETIDSLANEGRADLEAKNADEISGVEMMENESDSRYSNDMAQMETRSGGRANSIKTQNLIVYTRKGVKKDKDRPNHHARASMSKVNNARGEDLMVNSTGSCQITQNHNQHLGSIGSNDHNRKIKEVIKFKSRTKRGKNLPKRSAKVLGAPKDAPKPRLKVLRGDGSPWLTPNRDWITKSCIKSKARDGVDKRPGVRRKLYLNDEPPHTSQSEGNMCYNFRPRGKRNYVHDDEIDHNSKRRKRKETTENMKELLDEARKALKTKTNYFMENSRTTIDLRNISRWDGSVVMSVVGALLTQNVTDDKSSDAFMKLAAKFSTSRSGGMVGGYVDECSNVRPRVKGVSNGLAKNNVCLDELITSFRKGDLRNWEESRILDVLNRIFELKTAKVIFEDISYVQRTDTSEWKALMKEAYGKGYKRAGITDTIDWEAVLRAPFGDIEECIKIRGEQFKLTFRILAFLIRMKRDHEHIDLEWLKHIPPEKARNYLCSIRGLGTKTAHCISLLSLGLGGFPVDTNASRVATRLGWVPVYPSNSSLEFHLAKPPSTEIIHQYLWPLIDNGCVKEQLELHYQVLTFGKTICSAHPNCHACPLTTKCKYYQSKRRSKLALNHTKEHEEHDGRSTSTTDLPDIEDIKSSRITRTTEHIAYIIPNEDIKKFGRFDERLPDDPNPYLFTIGSCDKGIAKVTVLIPCRTANKGTFPFSGTHFQQNEVFADSSSSDNPIEISSAYCANCKSARVYFGTSVSSITSGQTQEKIMKILNQGYICTREFDCNTRITHPLRAEVYAKNKVCKKSHG